MPLAGRIPPNILEDFRSFDRWASTVAVAPEDGTVTPEKLASTTIDLIDNTATTASATAVAAHVAASDPHTQYATDAAAIALANAAQAAAEGTAASALAAHVAAPDPHSQYLTQTEGDARYREITDALPWTDITGVPTVLARLFNGTGTPEGAVTAGVGSLFLRTDGGAGTSLYVKESGAGNTGWVGK